MKKDGERNVNRPKLTGKSDSQIIWLLQSGCLADTHHGVYSTLTVSVRYGLSRRSYKAKPVPRMSNYKRLSANYYLGNLCAHSRIMEDVHSQTSEDNKYVAVRLSFVL